VLQAMNSTPIISARIIRLTALLPPPPTPMTRIRAKFSESERNVIEMSSIDPWRIRLAGSVGASAGMASRRSIAGLWGERARR
jgi:hypothetical protein